MLLWPVDLVQIPPRSLTVVAVQVEKECLLGIAEVENEARRIDVQRLAVSNALGC